MFYNENFLQVKDVMRILQGYNFASTPWNIKERSLSRERYLSVARFGKVSNSNTISRQCYVQLQSDYILSNSHRLHSMKQLCLLKHIKKAFHISPNYFAKLQSALVQNYYPLQNCSKLLILFHHNWSLSDIFVINISFENDVN